MATFAETMLAKYKTLVQTSAGLDTVSVDGQPVTAKGHAVVGSVRYADVEAKYRYWKREVARQAGLRPPRRRGIRRRRRAARTRAAPPTATWRTSSLCRRSRCYSAAATAGALRKRRAGGH